MNNLIVELNNSLITNGISDACCTTMSTDSYDIALFHSPTYNCQNFSIANFSEILDTDEENYVIRELVFELYKIAGNRSLLLLDVNTSYASQIHAIFYDCKFIVDQPYESSNGSQMHLFYIYLNY